MNYRVIYAPEVETDLQEGIDWYNDKLPGLDARFLQNVKEQLDYIEKNPSAVAIRYDEIRCVKVKAFPYLIHFKVEKEIKIIKVIAIFNTSRNPAIWIIRDK
ncbi:MAG: type II toxin-antitoxin system RelE/ParE family toxin [Tannerellaceae bacterium]|nr:type II toxin-antitoxin system RelE/ParE family toxin [Tannerellaceae bacterium]